MKIFWLNAGYVSVIGVGLAIGVGIHLDAEQKRHSAWLSHLKIEQGLARQEAQKVSKGLASIYENLRTISLLPGVRKIDRHGLTLGEDGHETIQQIYNNLASNIDVSEVYIVPAGFDHDRIDPATGKPQAPILMFDHLIVNAAERIATMSPVIVAKSTQNQSALPAEVESYEYLQLKQQLTWFGSHFPSRGGINGMHLPMLSGAEVITCDNTRYINSYDDADRSGIIFSVPFYGPDEQLKGSISAIMLTNAVKTLLPSEHWSLISPQTEYSTTRRTRPIGRPIKEALLDVNVGIDSLFFEDVPIETGDARGPWTMRVEHPAAAFFAGADYVGIRSLEALGLTGLVLAMLAAIGWLTMSRRWKIRILHNSMHDLLTGLPNKALLLDRTREAVSRGSRGELSALLYLDLDRFKLVNDTMGHFAGDALLIAAARRMRECLRESDTLARIGGDEFVILLRGIEKLDDAAKLAQRIIGHIAEPFEIDHQQVMIGTSVGIALSPVDGQDADTLLRNADMALFRAKSTERGTWRYFEPKMDAELRERRQMELDLRHALARGELMLHYQPLVDAQTEEISGFEALMRWNHPVKGLIPPSDFIPVAEEIGAIIQMGEWAIRQACRDAAEWPRHIRIAVNLSAVQFRNEALPMIVDSALDETGLSASQLELEVTESVLLANDDTSLKVLNKLRSLGVSIVLDDFGTGYASLSYLRSFSFDKIKVDRSFVKDLGDSGKEIAIVKAIAALGVSLEMRTTAEGVETEEQFHKIREQGYTQVQGYFFGRPGPAAAAGELLRAKRKVGPGLASQPVLISKAG